MLLLLSYEDLNTSTDKVFFFSPVHTEEKGLHTHHYPVFLCVVYFHVWMEKCLSSFRGAAKRGVKVAVCRASFFIKGEIKHKQSTRGWTFIAQSRAYCSITRPGSPGLAQQNSTLGEGPLCHLVWPCMCSLNVDSLHPPLSQCFLACLSFCCVPWLVEMIKKVCCKFPRSTMDKCLLFPPKIWTHCSFYRSYVTHSY